MALIVPVQAPDATVPPIGDLGFARFPDVQPFSQRTASGYQDTLEGVVRYLRSLYLFFQEQNPQDTWDANVTLLIAAVNDALTAEQADVEQKIADALTAIAQSQIQVTDPAFLAVLQQAQSASRVWLDAHYVSTTAFGPISDYVNGVKVFAAPAPSGGDDSAAVQAVLDAAQATNGQVVFGFGTWKLNLATQQSFVQPNIRGRGKKYTILTPADTTKPILRLQGGSGGHSGGYLSDFTFRKPDAGVAGVGLELADVCEVQWDRIGFDGPLAEGIRFSVTQPNGFCEFNRGEASIENDVALPIRYTTANAQQTSFHGSGLTDGIVNFSGACAVQIDNYCFPYNAPMSCTFFSHAPNTSVFANKFTNSKPGFNGPFRIENQSGGVTIGADPNGSQVLLIGDLVVNTANTYLGQLYACHQVYWTSGRTFIHYKPWKRLITLVPGATNVDLYLANGQTAEVIVNVIGPNYIAWYRLSVWQNPVNNGGTVTVLDHAIANNGSGIGEVLFYFQGYQLLIKNDGFTNQYTATVTIAQQTGSIDGDNLRQ